MWRTFVEHLRLPLNLFLLPLFVFGIFIANDGSNLFVWSYIVQLIIIHVFLYGGINVFKSYYDHHKKESIQNPLQQPAVVGDSLFYLACCWEIIGFGLTLLFSPCRTTIGIYILVIVLSIVCSHPSICLKNKPWSSLIIIGLVQGLCPYILGYTCTRQAWTLYFFACMPLPILNWILTYLLTQICQIEQDKQRYGRTFDTYLSAENAFLIAISFFTLTACGFVFCVIDRWYLMAAVAVYSSWFTSELREWAIKFQRQSSKTNFVTLHRLMAIHTSSFMLVILTHTSWFSKLEEAKLHSCFVEHMSPQNVQSVFLR